MSLSIAPAASFPGYTVIELALDRVLHLLPAILAIGGVARLLLVTIPVNDARQLLASDDLRHRTGEHVHGLGGL